MAPDRPTEKSITALPAPCAGAVELPDPDQRRERRPQAGLLALLSAGHLVVDISQGALPAILPFLREAFSLSYAAAGTIILVASISSSVIQPLFGYLADRVSRRWLLPVSVLVSGAGIGLTGVVSSYSWILVLVAFSGLGIAAYHPEGYKTASAVAGARKATGLSFFSVGGNVGLAVGPVLITALVTSFGLPGSLGMMLPCILVACLLAAALPRLGAVTPPVRRDRRVEGARPMALGLILLILIVTLRSWAQLGLTAFVPFFYIDVLQGDPRMIGPLLFVFLGAGAVGTLVGGPLADRFGARRVIVGAFLCAAPLIAGFLLTRGAVAVLFLAASGFALVSTFTVSVVLAQAYLPTHLGMASGLIVGFAIGTGGIGVTGLGWVADQWGLLVALAVIVVLPFAGFVVSLFLPEPARS